MEMKTNVEIMNRLKQGNFGFQEHWHRLSNRELRRILPSDHLVSYDYLAHEFSIDYGSVLCCILG